MIEVIKKILKWVGITLGVLFLMGMCANLMSDDNTNSNKTSSTEYTESSSEKGYGEHSYDYDCFYLWIGTKVQKVPSNVSTTFDHNLYLKYTADGISKGESIINFGSHKNMTVGNYIVTQYEVESCENCNVDKVFEIMNFGGDITPTWMICPTSGNAIIIGNADDIKSIIDNLK